METDKPAGAGSVVADRIERQQRTRRAALAAQKHEAGQELTRAELRDLRWYENTQLAAWGPKYLKAMPKGKYAKLAGRQSKLLLEAADKYGLPYEENEEDTVDVGKVLRWFHDFLAANGAALTSGIGDGDDAILHMASGKLKDEYVKRRIAEKDVDIERKRIELQAVAANFYPIEPLRQIHNQEADLIRRLRLKLAKHFDGDARAFIEEQFDDLFDNLERLAAIKLNGDGNLNTSDDEPVAANAAE